MLNWRRDALVRLEKRLYALAPRLVRLYVDGAGPDLTLVQDLRATADALVGAQGRYFDDYSIKLSSESVARLSDFAAKLCALADAFDRNDDVTPGPRWADWCLIGFSAEVEEILDMLRACFLGVILQRQDTAQRQSRAALEQISRISRQIYFISINVSVEAARSGEDGQRFAEIGQQIRVLSQDVSKALDRVEASDPSGRVSAERESLLPPRKQLDKSGPFTAGTPALNRSGSGAAW